MTSQAGAGVNKKIILIIATTTAFILPFLVASVNVALPVMGREFAMEAVVMSWVGTSYFLAIAIVQVPFGRLSDIYGRKKLFLVGLVVSSLASIVGGFANSVPLLIISRAFQGLGAGMTFNNSVAILMSVFTREERAKALGISQSGTYLGLSLGPLIGGLLTEHLGWQSIFLVSGGLGIILLILVLWGLKTEWCEAKGEKFDITGSVAYIIAIALFMYGFSNLPSTTGIILFVVGVVGMFFFVRWELKAPSPVFDLTLFRRNRVFIFSNLAALITYLSTFAVTFLLSLYLQYIKDYTAQSAGLVLIASSVLMTIFTLSSGFISQKYEPRLVATAGMALNLAALIMLIFVGDTTSIWYIVVALAIYGTGIGLFVSPNTNTIMGSVANRVLGVASGTLGTMRTAGMMLSMGITMILFSLYIGQAEITPVYYPQFLTSVRVGFIVFSVLGFGGVIAQMVARRSGKEPASQ
ncbi:MAG: MFS transporter [Chloroflexi bacterium RBG_16_50_11]|nr:MAG: MFS transporter [Chloroflexi bacterium RBG_16_50_11]